MKKIIVSMCAVTIAAGGVLPARQAQAGFWGKAAAGAVALAAGYYLGRRSNPPGTTYIIQSPQYSYDGGGGGGGISSDSSLASYLAEHDRQAAEQAEMNASRAPQRIFDKPNWRPTELKILEANRPRIKDLQRQIHEKVVAAEREMTPKNRWACFAICGRFGVGDAYGSSMTVDGVALVTTGTDQKAALTHLNDQCKSKYKSYHLFMDLDPDYLIMDAKVGEICGPLKPTTEACANSIPAAISGEWTNTKKNTDSISSVYDKRKTEARSTLLRLATRLHELSLAIKDSGTTAESLIKIARDNTSMFNYRNCDLGGGAVDSNGDRSAISCAKDGKSYLPLAGESLWVNSWGDLTLCAAENAPGTPVEDRVGACVSLRIEQFRENKALNAIDATGDKTLIEDAAYLNQLPVTLKSLIGDTVVDWKASDYLFGERGGYDKFHAQFDDGRSYLQTNPTEAAALDNGLIEMGCKPARQRHAELEQPGIDGAATLKSAPGLDDGARRPANASSQQQAG